MPTPAIPPHVLHHADDLDGRGAAAVAIRALFPDRFPIRGDGDLVFLRAHCHALSYNQPVPDLPDGCPLHILDYSFPVDTMRALAKAHPLVYIDHHAPQIRALHEAGVLDIFADADVNAGGGPPSALALAWHHYRPSRDLPQICRLLSLYDAAPDPERRGAVWDDLVLPVQHALRSWPTAPWEPAWDAVLDDDLRFPQFTLDSLVADGRAILRSRDRRAADFGPLSCYLVPLGDIAPRCEDPSWPVLCANGGTADYFPCHPDSARAVLYLSYRYDPAALAPARWKCTVWPGPAAPAGFHCGRWAAETFAGGGHQGVAGFHLPGPPVPAPVAL